MGDELFESLFELFLGFLEFVVLLVLPGELGQLEGRPLLSKPLQSIGDLGFPVATEFIPHLIWDDEADLPLPGKHCELL